MDDFLLSNCQHIQIRGRIQRIERQHCGWNLCCSFVQIVAMAADIQRRPKLLFQKQRCFQPPSSFHHDVSTLVMDHHKRFQVLQDPRIILVRPHQASVALALAIS
eukprot:Skav227644  [mRNA]  locus=scaffold58:215707:218108:- [translate_table: standard]